ncbi:MFS transporter [Rhodococcus koreensis]|uniref:Major Facilitator Superfamily protein n=1 Tax=Rhodococcus koreensis TaxID=99653 RepID=A0A1H4KX95_9NOCA|nr:MFS transporter [Rhodococcus koreensis]SEB63033.1 Major Facilitator Superfamily protein [Rhodococcus koreensis]
MSTLPVDTESTKPPATSAIVATLALAGIVVALMQTLVIPIIPHLPEYLDASASDTAWAVTATLLAAAVATPVMGRLGDMFGKRRMLLLSLVLLVIGSIVGALSSSLIPLIVGRTLQGLASGVIPLGISVMRDVVPKEKLAGAVAVMSASLGVGGAFGLPIAALIAEYADWHFLFWTSAVLGVFATALVTLVIPESPIRTGGTFDYVGAATLSTALITLLLAISKGSAWGWSSALILALITVTILALAAWGWWELRTTQPLVDLRVSMRRQVLLTNLASIVFGFAMFAATMVMPQIVQLPEATGYGLGGSMLTAGLVMAPFGMVLLVAAPVSSHLTNSYGPKITLMIGAVVVAVGYGVGIFMLHSIWQLVVTGVVIGIGTGLAYGAMPALIMAAVPASQTGAANSFNTLMRALGTSFASAIAGVVLAQMTTIMGNTAIPTESAFRVIMAVAAGSAIAALAVAVFLPRHHHALISSATSESTMATH